MMKILHKIGQKRRKCPHFLSFFFPFWLNSLKKLGKIAWEKEKRLWKNKSTYPPPNPFFFATMPFLGFPIFFHVFSTTLPPEKTRTEKYGDLCFFFNLKLGYTSIILLTRHREQFFIPTTPHLKPNTPPALFPSFRSSPAKNPLQGFETHQMMKRNPSRCYRNSPPLDESITQRGRKPLPRTTPKKIVLM